jgi:hypothetical protein
MPDPTVGYRRLLARPNVSEGTLQRYLEEHSELIPTPWLLNHKLHDDSVITKLEIGTSLISDFAYLTKSTVEWWLVLIEIERSDKRIFTRDENWPTFTAQFTRARAQVDRWRTVVERKRDQLVGRMDPLRHHLRDNLVSFKYVLVYGRDETNGNQARIDALRNLNTDDVKVMTHDSLIRGFKPGLSRAKNILSPRGEGFKMKYLHQPECNLWAYVRSHDLKLTPEHIRKLRRQRIEVDAWLRGEALTIGGRRSSMQVQMRRVLRPGRTR